MKNKMDLETLKKYITFTNDKVIIDKNFYEKVFMPSMDNAVKFKHQLISFLEDKIKEYKKLEKYLYEKENTKLVRKATISGCIGAFQEVLDFVNKGGKE